MDIFYFLVTSSKSWTTNFHQNFFIEGGGFTNGFLGALALGVVLACIFYFFLCNSEKTSKQANIGVWSIFLVIAGIAGYLYADMFIIGKSNAENGSVFKEYSFYQANQDYYVEKASHNPNKATLEQLNRDMNNIKSELDKGGDVRFDFSITTAVLCILFFFITSMIVKRFTINGKSIPMLKP